MFQVELQKYISKFKETALPLRCSGSVFVHVFVRFSPERKKEHKCYHRLGNKVNNSSY